MAKAKLQLTGNYYVIFTSAKGKKSVVMDFNSPTEKSAMIITRHYIRELCKEYPELKDSQFRLVDKRTVKCVKFAKDTTGPMPDTKNGDIPF
jgi:hypothetical protein